ncbi:polysaccharide deacetylase family protein [Nanoarchaeota archaeon]
MQILMITIIIAIIAIILILVSPFIGFKPKRVLLSFDTEHVDSEESINSVLEVLKENDVKATFFIMTNMTSKKINVIEKIHDKGHELACHTHNHPDMKKITKEEKEKELDLCIKIIQDISGINPTGFRAPYHEIDSETFEVLKEKDFKYDASLIKGHLNLFVRESIPEIKVTATFGLPIEDYFYLYVVNMPNLYTFLQKHKKGKTLSLLYHPRFIGANPEILDEVIKYHKNNGAEFLMHEEII